MQMYVSMTHEMKMRGIYAGIDCCCNAGSIAISNEAPLSSDIDKECKFKLRTIRGRLGGWLGGRLFRLHRYRTWWRRVSDGPSFGLKPRSSRGRPATGHIGNFRRSSPSSTRAGSKPDLWRRHVIQQPGHGATKTTDTRGCALGVSYGCLVPRTAQNRSQGFTAWLDFIRTSRPLPPVKLIPSIPNPVALCCNRRVLDPGRATLHQDSFPG